MRYPEFLQHRFQMTIIPYGKKLHMATTARGSSTRKNHIMQQLPLAAVA